MKIHDLNIKDKLILNFLIEWLMLFDNFKNGLSSAEFIYGEIEAENDYYEDELAKYKTVLKDANEISRTISEIAYRKGVDTNWDGFSKELERLL